MAGGHFSATDIIVICRNIFFVEIEPNTQNGNHVHNKNNDVDPMHTGTPIVRAIDFLWFATKVGKIYFLSCFRAVPTQIR